ncbi:MAG: class I SAM-dependent methyltransferase [Nitrospira sp.]|nr:class I SAM-dependent methyltransferase [Nitrospira sp.]
MINGNGWAKYCIWEHSSRVKELYARRCRLEVQEMTCAAQCAEMLTPHVTPGDSLLDAGCGSGYFFHSLRKRGIPVEYFGIDAAPSLVEIGRQILPQYGLAAERLQVMRIEDLDGDVDHVVCMNVLSNLDNYHRPLERLLRCARKTVIVRESAREQAEYAYVPDKYLDGGVDLKVYVNAYPIRELTGFMESYGFTVTRILDRHSAGKPQDVIGYPHYWVFFLAVRT